MENRKGSGIFLGVIGVATLLVAIIGATFAFFAANAQSSEDAISATGASLALGFKDNTDGLKFNLIPAEDYIAEFSATNEEHIADPGRCLDDNGNEICGYYTFTIGNPSYTTQQQLFGSVKVASNEFANLYFMIYDETGAKVLENPINFTSAVDGVIELPQLNQDLLPSSLDSDGSNADFNAEDPTTYTPICEYDGTTCTETNVRTYSMIVWIEETGANQNESDSGKTFAAGINFTSGSDTSGVTGVISAAQKPTEGGA